MLDQLAQALLTSFGMEVAKKAGKELGKQAINHAEKWLDESKIAHESDGNYKTIMVSWDRGNQPDNGIYHSVK
jgi:hypothetical protein